MKKLCTLAATFGAACLISGAAMAADAPQMEAYAHPTLFGSSAQTQVSADGSYIVGGKILKTDSKNAVNGKSNVIVDSFTKDVLKTIQTNTSDKIWNAKMPILRSELAVVLAEGLSLQNKTDAPYSDIVDGYWAKCWIEKALAADIMIGYPDKTFKPDQPVTKAEVFATIAKLIDVATDKSMIIPELNGYEMQYIPKWATAATKEVMASGLLNGVPCAKKVASEEYLTKEQVATLVGNLRVALINGSTSFDSAYADGYTPTAITIKLSERLSAKTSNIGDKFTAKTTKAVTVGGQTFEEGATVKGEVVEVARPGVKNPGYIKVKFTEITADGVCVEFPKTISEAQAEKIKNPNVIARLFGFPFSAAGRVVGVAGRSVSAIGTTTSNGLEQLGDNLSNTFVNTLSLQPIAGLRSFGGGFVTVGKGIFDISKTVVSGTFGVLYEVTDEVKYLILPSCSNDSSLNPGEELTIVF